MKRIKICQLEYNLYSKKSYFYDLNLHVSGNLYEKYAILTFVLIFYHVLFNTCSNQLEDSIPIPIPIRLSTFQMILSRFRLDQVLDQGWSIYGVDDLSTWNLRFLTPHFTVYYGHMYSYAMCVYFIDIRMMTSSKKEESLYKSKYVLTFLICNRLIYMLRLKTMF